MIQWIQMLLCCSLAMTALTGLYVGYAILFRKRYAAKWFYLAGIILLIGFIVPFRPKIQIRQENVPKFILQAASHKEADMESLPAQTPALALTDRTATTEMATQTTQATKAPLWWHFAFLIWATGAIGSLCYYGIQHIRFLRAVKRWSAPVEDTKTLTLFELAKASLSLKRRHIDLLQCACVSSPMLILSGRRPTILLPGREMSADDLRFIFLHELIHYKRRDLLCKALMLLATAMHWFNPAVYYLSKVVALHCETSCDEKVIEKQGIEGKNQYVMSILGMAQYQATHSSFLTTSFYGGKDTMKRRLVSILNQSKKRAGFLFLAGILVLTFAAGTAFAVDAQSVRPYTEGVYYPVGDSEDGVVDPVTMTCYGKRVYGIYDTNRKDWKLNSAYTLRWEEPIGSPPDNAVCLLTVYDGTQLLGYEEISYEVFMISLPTRLRGEATFDEQYGRYKAFGFDHYFYDGRNVRGFWDANEEISLINIDPVSGGLFDDGESEYGVYLMAEYNDDTLIGLKEITVATFSAIPEIIEQVEAIQEQYFR